MSARRLGTRQPFDGARGCRLARVDFDWLPQHWRTDTARDHFHLDGVLPIGASFCVALCAAIPLRP
eukprot:5378854-Lingulodinium_polyedra.AAC.1